MKHSEKISSRRKFVFGLWIISLFGVFGLKFPSRKVVIACAPPQEKKKVKMLTQEGKLVELESQHVKTRGKKISNDELKTWVKNHDTNKLLL